MPSLPKAALLLLAVCWPAPRKAMLAQQPTTPAPAADQQASASTAPPLEVPVTHLEWKPADALPGFTAPAAIALPIQCSPDGAAFLSVLAAPDFQHTDLTSISGHEVTHFDLGRIPDLQDISVLDSFPSDDALTMLVYAAAKKTDGSTLTDGKKRAGDYHQYIVTFDRKGNYKTAVELPAATHAYHLAALPSGHFLLSAFDKANNVPRLLLVDEDGKTLRQLQLPQEFEQIAELNQGEQAGSKPASVVASQLFSHTLFTAQRGGVVFWRPGSTKVLSITGESSLNEGELQAPKGYSFESLLPADRSWIATFRRSSLPREAAADSRPSTRNFLMYEVDQHDGSLVRELQSEDGDAGYIACASSGKLQAFKGDKQSQFIPLFADVP